MTSRSVSCALDASAADVFSVVTDIARLPKWNTAIAAVVRQPDRAVHAVSHERTGGQP